MELELEKAQVRAIEEKEKRRQMQIESERVLTQFEVLKEQVRQATEQRAQEEAKVAELQEELIDAQKVEQVLKNQEQARV